ncbi:methylase of polypeptide subunit release factors [Arthrobacter stackebrandtii]|uniref:Methylase of polypeptide subunit release factors n=1 Tax=Arthrobacter stackebrandtii TaxID=272161 RepID=A0ABS4YZ68_9MICC|nr:class I SAM-dependent methyltransferase [Arthrobacter stackebrandtii]MBP2414034.1 methylase of polypeptide subunit release factors [Arthrobacter stackebrandtii]PYG99038.1 methyltransferase [Arthrobacter stackebrandtii]
MSTEPSTAQSAPTVSWMRDGAEHTARWFSAGGAAAPRNVTAVDDSLTADDAYRLAAQGTAMLWQGDYHNARQLLSAMARRLPAFSRHDGEDVAKAFYRYRQGRTQRARMLGLLLVPLEPGPAVALRRAPDVAQAWAAAAGDVAEATVTPLQDVLGAVGAFEWRRNGVFVEELDAVIHPHYGTFAPIRSEYLGLVDRAELPSTELAFDIGTGTGVLAAILAKRGVKKVIATDTEPRAIACARENLASLGLDGIVEPTLVSMFPDGKAPLIVCNPPWLPGTANTLLDNAVYDPKSRMLKAFITGLRAHLAHGGEGWLIISDLAEHLGLRSRDELLQWIANAGLEVRDKLDTEPRHPRSMDRSDPFFDARSREVTSLWKLAARS